MAVTQSIEQLDDIPGSRRGPGESTAEETRCCVVGAGPAGMVFALLLARQGVPVTLLEAHRDFERDFRGDSIHPATLELLDQIGAIARLFELPHSSTQGQFAGGQRRDVSHLKTKYPYVVRMPQARFLEFLMAEAARYPTFQLRMGARVEELIQEGGNICGVTFRDEHGTHQLRALLTVAADGRFSKVRQLAGFTAVGAAPPLDVLWFRLPQSPEHPVGYTHILTGQGGYVVCQDRLTEWQVGWVFPKGTYQQLRAAGLEALRRSVSEIVPWLAPQTDHLRDWKQTSLLSVESSRIPRWYRPGLLLIGDAAHVMSPVGGVGINLAIQDAVAASRLLGGSLKAGAVSVQQLAAVQRRREWPTRLVQTFQAVQQQRLVQRRHAGWIGLAARIVARIPQLQQFQTRLFMFGGLHFEGLEG